MRLFFATALALFLGLAMTRVFKYMRLRLPDVTAFLVAGIIAGPYVLGALGVGGLGFASMAEIERVTFLSNAALGFIAFDIGNEFRLSQLKTTGKAAAVIGVFQALTAALVVDGVLIGLHFILGEEALPLPVAVTLGAIAAATAPAATMMVVRQYKAKGPLTDLLLPIVALDDAVGLIIYAVSIGIAQALIGGTINVISVVVNPLLEIVCSLLLGAVMGAILTFAEKLFFSNSNRLSLAISFVLITIALSSVKINLGEVRISFSSLLVCMMLGTVFCNMSEYSPDIMERSGRWTAPLYTVFFVISGAQLELNVFRDPTVIIIGAVYIISRCIGKYFGSRISSDMMKCPEKVRKYLGVTLFPQAGVALGMVVSSQVLGPQLGGMIRNLILFGVMIYELVGPLLTKLSLEKAGEISPALSEKQSRERFKKKAKLK